MNCIIKIEQRSKSGHKQMQISLKHKKSIQSQVQVGECKCKYTEIVFLPILLEKN